MSLPVEATVKKIVKNQLDELVEQLIEKCLPKTAEEIAEAIDNARLPFHYYPIWGEYPRLGDLHLTEAIQVWLDLSYGKDQYKVTLHSTGHHSTQPYFAVSHT